MKFTLFLTGYFISYFAQKFVTDTQVSCYLKIRKPLMELRIFFNEVKVALVCSFTQIIYHSSLQSNVSLLSHHPKQLLISKKDKEFAYTNLPKIEKLFRVMTQKTHVALQRRMIDNLSKTADQRYSDFIEKYPQIHQRLSNLQIAAYLGISHEFLSKIRKKIATKR